MSLDLLVTIDNDSLYEMLLLPKQVIGNNIKLHTESNGLPELKGIDIVIIGLIKLP